MRDNIVKNTTHIYIVYIHMICRITPVPLTGTQTQLISIHFSTEDKQTAGSADRDSFSGLDRRDHHRHHRLQNFRHLFSQQRRYRRKQTVPTSEHSHQLYPTTTTTELPPPYRIVSYQHPLMSAIAWLTPNYSLIHSLTHLHVPGEPGLASSSSIFFLHIPTEPQQRQRNERNSKHGLQPGKTTSTLSSSTTRILTALLSDGSTTVPKYR